jgi:ParB-like chromosome segregation protein Spo0J
MNVKKVKLSEIKNNPNNPRILKDDKFAKLVKSIKEFPKMLEIRPIVVNSDMIVLGGNMRLKACKEAGLKEVPIVLADDLTEDEQKQFIIKDNLGYGEWDWDMLANEWESELLEDWGLEVWKAPAEIDYSILDDNDLTEELGDMAGGVRKAIQIEFETEHYEEAFELVKFWREQNAYVGAMIIEHLKAEKEKL